MVMNARTRTTVASPRARRALLAHRIDPATVKGSGPNGRIVEADVLARVSAAAPATITSNMRRAIAQRTTESARQIPHFYLRAEVDATMLLEIRKSIVARVEAQDRVRITLTDFLVRAVALALRDHPKANCIWDNDELLPINANNVGLVMALEEGLVIPAISNADQLTIAKLAGQRIALQSDAEQQKRQSSIRAAISISNLGNSRVDEFDAIIPLGQSMILGVGRTALRPFACGERLELRQTLKLSLALDHRVHDGAPGAQFLQSIVEHLEQPASLLI